MASDSVSSSPSSNKRQKALTPSGSLSSLKLIEVNDYDLRESQEIQQLIRNDPSQTCTICFSEDGKSARGKLDCCDHHFCFVCIMEWAKIESRCPSCKRRFSTIRRQPIDGFFLCERIVKVPVRDQTETPHGNTASRPHDPYAQVCCFECNGMNDDSLLLLCDLCDSAAHTYCVGLGYTVPEGDWFCPDCTVARAAHDETNEIKADIPISGIAKESNNPLVRRPLSKGIPLKRSSMACDQMVSSDARTLGRCRNVHSHIRVLRDNWASLQRGSLRFSYGSSTSSINRNCQNESNRAQMDTSTSGNCDQTRSSEHNRRSDDIDKAWRMLKLAKCIQPRTNSVNRASINLSGKAYTTKKANDGSSSSYLGKSENCNSKNVGSTSSTMDKYKECSFKSPKLDKQKGTLESKTSLLTKSSGYSKSSLTMKIWNGQGGLCGENETRLSKKIIDGAGSSSSGKVDVSLGNYNSGKGCIDSNAMKDNDAKSEIQSLVKINLKLLSKEKSIDRDLFKEIARLSTHTILASCGLEASKSGIRTSLRIPSPRSVCNHTEQDKQLRKSTLLPYCCRKCFFFFVKEVVNVIMVEKVGCAKEE